MLFQRASMSFSLPCALAAFVVLLAAFVRALFQARRLARRPVMVETDEHEGKPWPTVSIIIPARNEEENIDACLASLGRSDVPLAQVVVVDDASNDATVERAKRWKDRLPLKIMAAPDVGEPGLNRKSLALWRGASVATGEWLLFLDADVAVRPSSLGLALTHCRVHGAKVFSCGGIYPNHSLLVDVLEDVTYLCTFLFMPLRAIDDPADPITWVTGQFVLFDRRTYLDLGGHRRIATFTQDDLALGRLCKREALPYHYVPQAQLFECRNYATLSQALRGWARMTAAGAPWLGFGPGTFLLLLGSLGALGCSMGCALYALALGTPAATFPHLAVLVSTVGLLALQRRGMGKRVAPAALAPLGLGLALVVYLWAFVLRFGRGKVLFGGRELRIDRPI
ncbi:MAG: hypothetical protein A2284_01850 [Deltaproteobacteria bacterium RIFOXYA12_FULL_61_11]|nr:MAG: hypothetical protein A2284_01850 [Deltaproteobacteria bacterium RIFOXYA12_FULL_61_11]